MDFTGSINPMRLKGAQCVVIEQDGKKLRGVFIPADFNDMIRLNKQTNVEEIVPYINIRVRVTRREFVDACLRNHAGEDGYQAPSHTIDVSFGKEFRERAIAAASRRIAAERASAGQSPLTEEQLAVEAKRAVYITLGVLTPVEQQSAGGYTPTVVGVASSAQVAQPQYAQPSAAGQAPAEASPAVIDDLPF